MKKFTTAVLVASVFSFVSFEASAQEKQRICRDGRPAQVKNVQPLGGNTLPPRPPKNASKAAWEQWSDRIAQMVKEGKAEFPLECPEDGPSKKPSGPSTAQQLEEIRKGLAGKVSVEVYQQGQGQNTKLFEEHLMLINGLASGKLDRSEYQTEIDKLWAAQQLLGEKIDGLKATDADHENRLKALENAPKPTAGTSGADGKDGEDGGGYAFSLSGLGGAVSSDVIGFGYVGLEPSLTFDNKGQTMAFAIRGGVQRALDSRVYPTSLSLDGGPVFSVGQAKQVKLEAGLGINGFNINGKLQSDATMIRGYGRVGYEFNEIFGVFGQGELGGMFSEEDPARGVGFKLGLTFTVAKMKYNRATESAPKNGGQTFDPNAPLGQ